MALGSQKSDLRGVDVKLKLYYDTMPITSTMTMGVSDVVGEFKLPDDYVSSGERGGQRQGEGGAKRKRRLAEEKRRGGQ